MEEITLHADYHVVGLFKETLLQKAMEIAHAKHMNNSEQAGSPMFVSSYTLEEPVYGNPTDLYKDRVYLLPNQDRFYFTRQRYQLLNSHKPELGRFTTDRDRESDYMVLTLANLSTENACKILLDVLQL